ncbi:MAG: tRNA (adenosine(37)-N6)-dimethylallyltransferase MiaA [Clostridia bacterium]|nr:tRNA (adenosine(37)-N6)-dimethylallyltransferase MiaA [Clostridia bacterium]
MEKTNKPRVLAIVGPTAVGKTALAIELAKRLNGEIISCDSMQIYRGMDIGTAKATIEERAQIKHHLIDILDPHSSFSCADYQVLAREAINDILSRKKTPIFCGGTGLYLDSVLEIPSFTDTVRDDALRAELEAFAKENGAHALHNMLRELDPESAEQIHENNIKRVIRAIEIFKTTGKRKSELDALSREQESPYDSVVFFLCARNKELLYSRIEARVDLMLSLGLLDECRALYNAGVLDGKTTASGAIGYKELIPYLKGEASFEDCVAQLKLSTRHYAKRQLTWFKKKNYHTIYTDEISPLDEALRILRDLYEGTN